MKKTLALLLVVLGILAFAFGDIWAPSALALLPDQGAGPWLELFLPFLPMALIIAGALLYRPQRRTREK